MNNNLKMRTLHKASHAVFLTAVMKFGLIAPSLFAEPTSELIEPEVVTTTSVQGRVVLPEDVSEGIDVGGISLDKAIIKLEGDYKHPRLPYPENWRSITPEEREEWLNEFKKSEAYQEYEEKVEAAQAKRAVFSTEIAEDGTFIFEDIKPTWYQLSVMVMHPNATGEPSSKLARGHVMRQFIIKDVAQPYNVGALTLEVKNVLLPGDVAPDLTAVAYDGSEFKLSDFQGQFVLIDFWATWCAPCRAEIPNLEAVYEEFGGENFEMIGLSIDKSMDMPEAFHEKKPSGYLQGFLGADERYQGVREDYGIRGIPSIWLIGPDGKVVARDLRGMALREAVEAALASPTE